MILRSSWSLVACRLAACTLWVAVVASASAATWYPELKLESRYDDNVLHTTRGSDDFVGVVTPGLALASHEPVTSYELAGRTGFTSYTRTGIKSSRLDEAWLDLSHKPDYTTSVDVHARYLQSLDPIDFSRGAVTSRHNVTAASANATFDLHWIGAAGELTRWDYAAGDLADGNSVDGTGRLFPLNTRDNRVALAVRHRELRIRDLVSLEADYETAAYRRHHTETLWSEVEAGRVAIQFHDGSANEVKPAVAFRAGRTGGTERAPTTLRLEVANDVATTFDADVSHSGAGRFADIELQTSVDADGGIYHVATLDRRASLAARDTLPTGQVIDVMGSFGRIRPLRGSNPKVDVWRASIGFSMPLGPYLSGRAGWDFLRQDAPVGQAAADFDRNRYSIALTSGLR